MECLKVAKTLNFLSYACERRQRKEEEKIKMTKVEIFKFGFSNLIKVYISGTFGVDIALE